MNFSIVTNIIIHSKTMINSPPSGDCIPKNTMDQIVFKNNCTIKIINADFTILFFRPSFQIINSEIPIIRYNTVHTGPNSQLGGFKEGLFRAAYHVGMESIVNTVPIKPAA